MTEGARLAWERHARELARVGLGTGEEATVGELRRVAEACADHAGFALAARLVLGALDAAERDDPLPDRIDLLDELQQVGAAGPSASA